MSAAREEMLGRVRSALTDVPTEEAAHTASWLPEPAPAPPTEVLAALFRDRLEDYAATVTEVADTPEAVRAAIAEVIARHHAEDVLAAPGFPADWLPPAVCTADAQLSLIALDALDGVLTTCAVAVATTGTIALDGGPGQGARAFGLVPDLHVCVVRADQLVMSVADAIGALALGVRERGAPVTFVSGPSATSDIELSRVEGVHGPRRLEVVIVLSDGTFAP